jgi:hypothetical protein
MKLPSQLPSQPKFNHILKFSFRNNKQNKVVCMRILRLVQMHVRVIVATSELTDRPKNTSHLPLNFLNDLVQEIYYLYII